MPNMTSYDGYGGYPPNDYLNDYNKTNALLHLKYQKMNQTEVPQMEFRNREGNLNLNLIKNLDLNYVIKTNNIAPLEKLCHNLIYSEIKDEDYEDANIPKLLRTFQYALEYLNEKQLKLDQTNKKLDLEYNQLINQSYELEEKLKTNKREIARNSSEKKEKEMLLVTYESLVNFNINPIENTNILMRNIDTNIREVSSTMRGGTYNEGLRGRFYCHICSGKFFNTESGLENHMKRRHLAQMREIEKREREEKKDEEMKEIYDKKLEETKNYFQAIIQERNDKFSKNKYEDEINNMKKENDKNMKFLMDYTQNFSNEMRNMIQTHINNQDLNNRNIMEIANAAANKEREKSEPQKLIIENPAVNEINKLTNSIEQLGDILKNQKGKNNVNLEEENKFLKNQIEILENQSKINVNIRQISSNSQNGNPYASFSDKNNIINNNNFENNPYNINKGSNNKPNNNIIINNNNSLEKNKIIEQKIQNNPPQDIIQRNKKGYNESQIQEDEDKKNINIILSDIDKNKNLNQNNLKGNIPQFNNTAQNFNQNFLKIEQEESPQKKDINNFNKTAPNGFKKRKFKPVEPKKGLVNSNSMKELDIFYANFMNRDQPILEEEKPNMEEYLKEIIPEDKKQEDEKINNDLEKVIDEKTQKQHFMTTNDFKNKDKNELWDIIQKTMKNIDEANANNKESQYYYETIQKAFDIKLNDIEQKMMKDAYDNKGQLKRSRSSSRAKIVIEQTKNELDEI